MAHFRAGQTPEDETQYGRQTPNGAIIWHSDMVAEKLGWTTTQGRLKDQAKFDHELRALGLAPDEGNILRWYSRVRYTGYTEPEEIVDVVDAPTADPIPVTAPEDAQADLVAPLFAADAPAEVGTAIDVSGSAEEGDPTHLIVGDDGLLLGTVNPTTAPAPTVPDWAQPAAPVERTAAIVNDDSTQQLHITIHSPIANPIAPSAVPF